MKKISRILSLRRPSDADRDLEVRRPRDVTHDGRSISAALPAFHQLPCRRVDGRELVMAKKNQELSHGLLEGGVVVVDGGPDGSLASAAGRQSRKPRTKVCPRCAAIDFLWLLDWKPGQPRPWVQLSHVLPPAPSMPPSPSTPANSHRARGPLPPGTLPCPFCLFFRAMIGSIPADGLSKFNPYLRIRQAFERLDGIGEKHELARSVLVEVTSQKKTLPWGYLMRAVDKDDDDISGYLAKEGEGAGIRGRQVSPLLSPSVPKCWLDFCRRHHADSACAAPAQPIFAGLRLIDCSEKRVIAADEMEYRDATEYLTLSYAWAQTGLDSSAEAPSNPSALRLGPHGQLPDTIPALFTDAIAFTEAIGFRYLWIDRFCLQVDSAARRRQTDRMGEIYSRSSLTLIIAADNDVVTGIAGLSTPREHQLSLRLKHVLYTTSLIRPDLEVASSRWASRAWTLQEGLLSRRRLIFMNSQMYFQCSVLHCYESISLPLRLAPDWKLGRVFPPGDGRPKQSGRFKDLIKTYMCRDMDNHEERLDAFKGLLQEYERMDYLPVQHFLGLPLFHPDDFVAKGVVSETDRLAIGLGWICGWTTTFETPAEPPCYRSSSFPSWTWLAWSLRSKMNTADHIFFFNLVGDASPILQEVSAAPLMEISVGFKDASVLSWEIDGDVISKKHNSISFLRLETYCFGMTASLDKSNAVCLEGAALCRENRRIVEGIVRASLPEPEPLSVDESEESAKKEFQLVGVLVSGRNWKDGSACQATALVCGRRGWEEDGPWVRLGAVAIDCEHFATQGHEIAVMQGIETDEDIREDLPLRLRELDLY